MRHSKKRTQRVASKNKSMRMSYGLFGSSRKSDAGGEEKPIVAGLSLDFDNCAEILLSLVEENDDVFRNNCKLYDIPNFTQEQETKILDNEYQLQNMKYDNRNRTINLDDEIQQFLSKVEPSATGKEAFNEDERKMANSLLDKIKDFVNAIPQDQKPNVICLFIGSIRQNQQIDEDNAKKHTLLIQYLMQMSEEKKYIKARTDRKMEIAKNAFQDPLTKFKNTPRDMRRSILMYPLLDKIADVLTRHLGQECNVTFQFEKGSLGDLEPITETKSFIKSLDKFDWNEYGSGFENKNITPQAAENIKKFINMYNVSRLLNLKRDSQRELHFNFIDYSLQYVNEFKGKEFKDIINKIKSTSNVNLHLSGTRFAYSKQA